VFAPAELALHALAGPELGVAAIDHQARAASDHYVTRLQRLGILAVPTSHLPVHVGVDRQKMCPGENLAVGRPRQRRFDEPEAIGHADMDDLAMCRHEGSLPVRSPDDATDR
jgi:hypothetical protein